MGSRPSYRVVDYRLRPAKFAERRMMVEALSRLNATRPVCEYQYVGMGAVFFVDATLVHRCLGIRHIVNIEKNSKDSKRFRLNSPYPFVDLRFGPSSRVLGEVDWGSRPSVVWLDYDGALTPSVLSDTVQVTASASAESVLIVTVRAEPPDVLDESFVRALRGDFDQHDIPQELSADDLDDWGLAGLYYRLVTQEVSSTVRARNSGGGERLSFQQMFHFHYRDGVRMLTVGGALWPQSQVGAFGRLGLDRLEYIRDGSEARRIRTPKLTPLEAALIERNQDHPDSAVLACIPQADVRSYIADYRYLPSFRHVEG